MIQDRVILTISTKKNLRSFITLKAYCSLTHLNSKIIWFLLVLHWALDVVEPWTKIHSAVKFMLAAAASAEATAIKGVTNVFSP